MTLAEYMRELILMNKQFGQEEELYPLINILLRQYGNINGISLRTVSKAERRSSSIYREMLFGYSSFPDLALLANDCDLRKETGLNPEDQVKKIFGCVEAKTYDQKETGGKLLDVLTEGIHSLSFGFHDVALFRINNDRYASAYSVINDLPDDSALLEAYKDYRDIDIKTLENKLKISRKNLRVCSKNPRRFYDDTASFEEKDKIHVKIQRDLVVNGLKDINDDNLEQFIGELLWYGKVLYTDGTIWKYVNICEPDHGKGREKNKEINRKQLYEDCFCIRGIKESRKDWIREICGKTLTIKCTKIGELKDIYDELKKEDDINKIKTSIEQNPDWEDMWETFTSNLSGIKWTPDE